jgi:hypothetical protein
MSAFGVKSDASSVRHHFRFPPISGHFRRPPALQSRCPMWVKADIVRRAGRAALTSEADIPDPPLCDAIFRRMPPLAGSSKRKLIFYSFPISHEQAARSKSCDKSFTGKPVFGSMKAGPSWPPGQSREVDRTSTSPCHRYQTGRDRLANSP